jgi:hypothetical protein
MRQKENQPTPDRLHVGRIVESLNAILTSAESLSIYIISSNSNELPSTIVIYDKEINSPEEKQAKIKTLQPVYKKIAQALHDLCISGHTSERNVFTVITEYLHAITVSICEHNSNRSTGTLNAPYAKSRVILSYGDAPQELFKMIIINTEAEPLKAKHVK